MNSGRFAIDPAAATDGREVILGVGLFITGGAFWSGTRAKLASVVMLEVDMLRAGETGLGADAKGEGDGFGRVGAGVFCCDGCRGSDGAKGAEIGAEVAVGVACGVDAAEFAFATEIGCGACRGVLAAGGW